MIKKGLGRHWDPTAIAKAKQTIIYITQQRAFQENFPWVILPVGFIEGEFNRQYQCSFFINQRSLLQNYCNEENSNIRQSSAGSRSKSSLALLEGISHIKKGGFVKVLPHELYSHRKSFRTSGINGDGWMSGDIKWRRVG